MSDIIAVMQPRGPVEADTAAATTITAPITSATSTHTRLSKSGAQSKKKSKASIQPQRKPPPSSSESIMDGATADATCKKLVSILALAAGFEGITAGALYTLTNAFENYTQQIYRIAHSFAELAGRTQPNVYDLQQAFADMSLSAESLAEYAKKASQSSTPLLLGPLQETIAKPKKKKEKTTVLLDSDIEDNSESDEEDNKDAAGNKITARTPVPDHLPPFPSKHSYRQTARPTDPQKIRELNAEQSRLVESNLKRLMAAENKVAMAAHKDTLQQHQQEILPVALGSADLANAVVVKEEPGSSSGPADIVAASISSSRRKSVDADRRATKLEILPVVNYETAKRQQQLSASGRDQRHEMKGGHMRGESGVNNPGSGSGSGSGSIGDGANNMSGSSGTTGGGGNGRAEWRMERRRLRREQNLMEGRDDSNSHKRQRQESQRMKLVSMEMDS
ncbi:transcription initiation factor TFIID subunit 8 [Podila epicladia]|nr:transcription initiation factor TFIID subunit 8 [Podila epicladia]